MKKIIAILIIIFQQSLGHSEPRKKHIFDLESIKMTILSMNTERSDFGPAIIGDSLYFSAFSNTGKKTKKVQQRDVFYDLFVSEIDPEGNIPDKREVIKQFSKNYHNGPVSWCPTTKELFITQSNYLQSGAIFNPFRKNYYNLQIVTAKQINGSWKICENFAYNNPQYSVGHPTISTTGDTLIFSSNKPGGLGETDLYMSIRKNGKWDQPKNLGPRINTPGKDEFPFLDNHGDLVFASNGRDGFGGLDLYYTKLNDSTSEIYHFKKPINSEYDDFSMIVLPEKNFGYLSSDRPGYGEDDIYKLTFNRTKENFLQLVVLDSKFRKPISDAAIVFNDSISLKTDPIGEVTRKIADELSLSLYVTANGYYKVKKSIKTGILKSGAVLRDTVLLKEVDKERYVIRNLYFDYDDWDLLPEALKELDHLIAYLINNPETKVNLSSHADSRGSVEYNLKLSQHRMKSAVDYLLLKGIDADRIDAKYFGKSMPVNNCVDWKNCTPQELRMNRRVEFFIAELGKSESIIQDKGDYSHISELKSSIFLHNSVVVGSFKVKSNAEKVFFQLKRNGLNPEIINHNALFIVKVGFKDAAGAKEEYQKLKETYQGAVLL